MSEKVGGGEWLFIQMELNFNGGNTPNLLPFIRYKKQLRKQAEEIYKQRIAEANRGGLFEFYSE